MGIIYQTGNIWATRARVIVIPVNCKGVAGCGLALQCKRRYPAWFQAYQMAYAERRLSIGYPVLHPLAYGPWILDFPTKDHYRFPSQLSYIDRGLAAVPGLFAACGVTSAAFPKLG